MSVRLTEAAKILLDAKFTLLPDRCTETVNVYHVNEQNVREGTRLYGILCMLEKEGKYPALLKVPGTSAWPYKWILKLQSGYRDHYYKRVYLGCVRGVDYIFSLPQFDGKNIAVTGGSRGGALYCYGSTRSTG